MKSLDDDENYKPTGRRYANVSDLITGEGLGEETKKAFKEISLKYVSITHHVQNYEYKNRWSNIVNWEQTTKSWPGNIEWSILIDIPTGLPLLRYSIEKGIEEINLITSPNYEV
jgi:hypothetical protein